MKRLTVLLAALFLICGCTLPEWEKENSTITEIPVAQNASPNASSNSSNSSAPALPAEGNQSQNQTAQNGTSWTIIPRNISEKISGGQFDIPDPSSEPLRIYVIDAGNTDSILLRKGQFGMLIGDGEAEPVNSFIRGIGVGKLEIMVATMDSPEAIAGIGSTMDEFEVGEIWDGAGEEVSAQYSLMRQQAQEKGAALKRPSAGDFMEIGEFGVFVLNPREGSHNSNPDNNAIVLKVSNGEFCMVLLNTIVQEWENSIISSAGNESLRCNVMTYFKHGQGRPTPPIILERIEPRDVIISVGPNSEGLPSPTTIERLELSGKVVWRTDVHGTLEIVNYGNPAYEIIAGK